MRWSDRFCTLACGRFAEVADLGAVIARRRLPLRVDPIEGEAIDSWLEATAKHMGTTVGALARATELPIATRPGWIRWLSANQLRTVEAATGVSQETVRGMTLSSYDGAALQLDPTSHRLDPTFPFGALVVCPVFS
jgi:TniQ